MLNETVFWKLCLWPGDGNYSCHYPKCKAPLQSSEEKDAAVHTVWSPACSPNAEMQPVWYHLSVTMD